MKISKKLSIILCISSIVLIVLNCYIIHNVRKEQNTMSELTHNINNEVRPQTDKADNTDNADNDTDNTNTASENSFYHEPLSEELINKISGVSYTPNDNISFSDLRHVVVKYYDFNNNEMTGELICNKNVADEVVDIFKELYNSDYQIEKIKLIDEYNGNDDASMADNNSSCFNYRTIDGTDTLSDHSLGLAIDINPLFNPYVRTGMGSRNVLPANGIPYADRTSDFPHKITKNDVCYNAFISRGWQWGGEWNSPIDYQHFYKEIPD